MVLARAGDLPNPLDDNVLGLDLDLLRPKVLSDTEKSRRRQWLRRIVWACLAVFVWSASLYLMSNVNNISLELQSRRLEKEALSAKIATLKSSGEPSEIQKAREDLHDQVDWATRLSEINRIVPEGCKVTQISVKKDGTVELGGEVSDLNAYGLFLDSLRRVGFIREITSASLLGSDRGFLFKIVAPTNGEGGAQDSTR